MLTAFPKKISETTLSFSILISGGIWGLYWIPLREIEGYGIPTYWSVFFINACPLILILPLSILKISHFRTRFWPTLQVGLLIGIAFTFYASALLETTIMRATLMFYLSPIWGTIIGYFFLSEPFTRARLLSICIAIVGLVLLLSGTNNSSYPLNIGDLFAFLSGILFSCGSSILKHRPDIKMIPLTSFVYIFTSVGAFLLIIFISNEPLINIKNFLPSIPYVFMWSTIILLPSFMIVFKVSQILFPGRVAILLMSEVVVAIISASVLVPEERMFYLQWLGALAIITAGFTELVIAKFKKKSSYIP